MSSWNSGWRKTSHPGIFATKGAYRVRVRAVDPRTGKQKEANQTFEGIDIRTALEKQLELRDKITTNQAAERTRVGAFAKYWIECKAGTVDPNTVKHYVEALEDHVLPTLGNYYLDEVRPMDVQTWINAQLRRGYRVKTVHSWYRAFRCMVRDAIAQLDLPRDPTLRITFPDEAEREEPNALTGEQLARFLGEMKARHVRDYPLVAMLAFSGLRFCHASAIRWEDIDEEKQAIRIVRKNVRGRIGPVSRKKRAPKEYPLPPELAEILRDHRKWMVEKQAPGVESGYLFPSKWGTLRHPGGLWRAVRECLDAIGVKERFTVHGLRRTFNDLSRRAGTDPVVIKSLTGHVSEKMREHYSTVGLDEKRAAVASVVRLVSGDPSGDRDPETKTASGATKP